MVVLGATDHPESVDPALLCTGRLSQLIHVAASTTADDRFFSAPRALLTLPSVPTTPSSGAPSSSVVASAAVPCSSLDLLKLVARALPLAAEVDLQQLAQTLHGYSFAWIREVCECAAFLALRISVASMEESERDLHGRLDDLAISPDPPPDPVISHDHFETAMTLARRSIALIEASRAAAASRAASRAASTDDDAMDTEAPERLEDSAEMEALYLRALEHERRRRELAVARDRQRQMELELWEKTKEATDRCRQLEAVRAQLAEAEARATAAEADAAGAEARAAVAGARAAAAGAAELRPLPNFSRYSTMRREALPPTSTAFVSLSSSFL